MYRLIGISGTEAGVGPNGENLTDTIFVYFKSKPVADGEYEIVLMEDTNDFSTLKNGETCVLTSEKTAYHSISTSEGKKAKVKMVNGKIKITIPAIKSKYGKENLIDDLTETTTVEAILKEN